MQPEGVSSDLQVRWMLSVITLYKDLFDQVCGCRGTDPHSNLTETSKVDGAVYMIWDMGGIEGSLCAEDTPDLAEAGISVLETVLRECRTSACLISALHGIGHVIYAPECDHDQNIANRPKSCNR